MKPYVTIAEATTRDGAVISLRRHDGDYHLRIGGCELMSTRATGSELRLAELACEKLGSGQKKTDPEKKVLIGGLGLGFTLRRVLELTQARVLVAELLPEIVSWNREHLRSVNGSLLDDPRVEVMVDDLAEVLARSAPGQYDAILLDVDNGPEPLVDRSNVRLYNDSGLDILSRALCPGGRAVFWSSSADPAFLRRLERAGFLASAVGARAWSAAKRDTHTLFVADRPK